MNLLCPHDAMPEEVESTMSPAMTAKEISDTFYRSTNGRFTLPEKPFPKDGYYQTGERWLAVFTTGGITPENEKTEVEKALAEASAASLELDQLQASRGKKVRYVQEDNFSRLPASFVAVFHKGLPKEKPFWAFEVQFTYA